MKTWSRAGIRTRLTVLYAAMFFAAGTVLVGLILFFLKQSFDNTPATNALANLQAFLGADGTRPRLPIDRAVATLAERIEQQRRDTLRAMLVWSFVALLGTGVVSVAFGWVLAGRALQPLHAITSTARRIADHNLHERISLTGPDDEIKELADTFDDMLERLRVAFDGHERFVANASHELRTPLAINRTLIEVALQDPETPDATRRLGETLLAVNHRHERLIDGLLLLASSEQGLGSTVEVDLAAVARRVVGATAGPAEQAGVTVTSQLSSAVVRGEPALLERLVGNLLDNAARYNIAADGWVDVRVGADAQRAWLTVANSGPVVAACEVDGLFERFRRLAPAETGGFGGAGLGLSIVRAVADAHQGQVQAQAHPGGGLTITVELPHCNQLGRND